MRRKDLVTTTMALTLAVFMSAVSTGCGHQSEVEDTQVAVESVTESTEVAEEGYKIVKVDKEYPAVTTVDCSLLDSADAVTEVFSLTKETYVTVYGDVTYNGIPVDFYAVRLDDGSTGFIDGKNLDFNVALEEDYADSLVEVEGGDGEEVTEEVVESTENEVEETKPVETFESYQMFTNTNCNVRAQASKDSELVATLSTNTEITVVGIEGEWSKVEVNGLQAYIKSSLLSKEKVAVKTPSSSSSDNSSSSGTSSNQSSESTSSDTSSSNQGGTSQPSSQPSQQSTPSPAQGDPDIGAILGGDGNLTAGDMQSGGTTGSTTDGESWGGVY